MYQPAHFREDRPEVQFDLIRAQPLGLLISQGGGGLQANPIPFVAYPGEGREGVLRAHVARANPQWRELLAAPDCLVVFQGPQAYLSPNWYPSKAETHKVVPTWNYATVHVWARAQVVEDAAWLRRQLDDLTAAQEGRFPQPWRVDDAPPDFLAAQLKAIVGLELAITRREGKWKLSQNRSAADQRGAREGLRGTGDPESAAVAELMASWTNPPRPATTA